VSVSATRRILNKGFLDSRPPTKAGSGGGESGPLTQTGTASPSGPSVNALPPIIVKSAWHIDIELFSPTEAALLRVCIAQSVLKIGNELLEAFSRGQVRNLLQQPARLLKLLLQVGSGFVAITHHATPVFIRRWSGENVQFLLGLTSVP
jgi:hypothetical protein